MRRLHRAARRPARRLLPRARGRRRTGHEIVTVEGLGDGGELHPLQQAFLDHDAFQCGYCTPGQICSAVGMLAEAGRGWPSAVTDGVA